MRSPSCEDSADHSTNWLAAFQLDIFQLGENVGLAPQPSNKLTSRLAVIDIIRLNAKVIADNKIYLQQNYSVRRRHSIATQPASQITRT